MNIMFKPILYTFIGINVGCVISTIVNDRCVIMYNSNISNISKYTIITTVTFFAFFKGYEGNDSITNICRHFENMKLLWSG